MREVGREEKKKIKREKRVKQENDETRGERRDREGFNRQKEKVKRRMWDRRVQGAVGVGETTGRRVEQLGLGRGGGIQTPGGGGDSGWGATRRRRRPPNFPPTVSWRDFRH